MSFYSDTGKLKRNGRRTGRYLPNTFLRQRCMEGKSPPRPKHALIHAKHAGIRGPEGIFTSEKNAPNNTLYLAYPGVARVTGRGKNASCCKPMVAHYLASKAGVFRLTGPDLRAFSTRTRTRRFTGFSGKGRDLKKGIRGRIGLIWDTVCQAGSVSPVFWDLVLGSETIDTFTPCGMSLKRPGHEVRIELSVSDMRWLSQTEKEICPLG